MNQHEAHRLVIQHLKVLEDAPAIVDEVQETVFAVIDKDVRAWVVSRPEQWQGTYSSQTGETYFQPVSWGVGTDDDYRAWYELSWTESSKFAYTLSALLGAVRQQFGLFFDVDKDWVTQLKGRKARAGWEGYLSEHFPATGLAELGFKIVDGRLFLPLRVDANALAEDYPASIEDALLPKLEELFGKLESAHPQIDILLREARQKFDANAA